MSARRSLLTATAAGALLGALWFVPSANATSPAPPAASAGDAARDRHADQASVPGPEAREGAARLADTGSFDTTPYVAGGTALLGLGAGFVAFSVRRERAGADVRPAAP
ncbi:LPXTG cell wall anchor domain-containing protein [Streptomyces alfalfae]|uniref:LAETG motif-containing sortase-dependent surface protein n=1 Tax=Streptomyces alfalfae TaxID=1642299 RepID=UPI0009755197|nr:LAETG motif-containing sortase-dependent surface protein [Streptomyces alfalfae]AYA17069.1 LPXTG cell wall anchor domain-containing protein [Streptomyces fradiae]RXX37794.1 LPXTG cell wall anchor domain-containing protein [Streptomyces alfalfae]RZN06044.1 LPXTG cell wall anchor domain-containing protein [Streptomyces alfalfae]